MLKVVNFTQPYSRVSAPGPVCIAREHVVWLEPEPDDSRRYPSDKGPFTRIHLSDGKSIVVHGDMKDIVDRLKRNREPTPFDMWWDEVKAEAARRGVLDLLGSQEDHREGFEDGETPADEVSHAIEAAQSDPS